MADFGLSRTREQTFASGTCNVGTPQYAAPEMLRSEPHGEAADVWSFGVTLYEILDIQGGTVYPLEGAAMFKVTFSLVRFGTVTTRGACCLLGADSDTLHVTGCV